MWWRRGALGGDADGQAMFGAALYLGAGVERDPIEGCAWLLRAQKGRSALAGQFLTAARSALAPHEHAEAERRALELPEPAS
jgi:TPR repeat protein